MFKKNPDQLYAHYLAWFNYEVADPTNWAQMRADKDCSNWMDVNDIPIPYDRGMALFKMSDPKKMQKAVEKKVASNKIKYNQMSQYINGDPKQGTLNQEYMDRFEVTKMLRELGASYSGDRGYGEDLLFNLKKECDADGRNFVQEAKKVIDQMKGEHIVPSRTEASQVPLEGVQAPVESKGSLAGDFLHLLWRHGLPIGRLLNKSLDVDVADKAVKRKAK